MFLLHPVPEYGWRTTTRIYQGTQLSLLTQVHSKNSSMLRDTMIYKMLWKKNDSVLEGFKCYSGWESVETVWQKVKMAHEFFLLI